MVTTSLILDTRKGEQIYPLKLRLTYKRKTAYISMNLKLTQEQWDGFKVIRHPRAQMLNNQLLACKAKIDNQIYNWKEEGLLAGKEAKDIKAMLEYEEDSGENNFPAYWKKAVARRTEKNQKFYNTAWNTIIAYDPRPSFEKIDLDWLIGFDRWMSKTMQANTRSIRMRCLRAVINDAINDEIITHYPFRKFKIKQEATRKKALSLEQLHTLRDWEVEEYQERYRDLFMLMVLMRGINIGDLCLLKKNNLIDGRIEYKRQKTHKVYSIKIEPEIQELIDRYSGHGEYLLNVMDSYREYSDFISRMNKGLKEIGEVKYKKQGKKEKAPFFPGLSTNWARHTFATIALNECELPRDMISDLLGHSEGLDVTNIYIKQDLIKMDAAARKVIDKVMYGK